MAKCPDCKELRYDNPYAQCSKCSDQESDLEDEGYDRMRNEQ